MKKTHFILAIIVLLFNNIVVSQDLSAVKELSGKWKIFIGDDLDFSDEKYDDSNWAKINVPGTWEEQGYYGYDGIAWYRTNFDISSSLKNYTLYLELGYIDDVDEIYFNGVKIGSTGTFPPNYKTAYNARRLYVIPRSLIHYNDKNTLAVRVFDEHLEGGIVRGNIQLLKEKIPMELEIDLQGIWKFKIGDDIRWSNQQNFDNWDDIIVPGMWENQGYNNYDGFAWYAIQFTPSTELANENLVFVLGKIDDIDQLYINGNLIAATGNFNDVTKNPFSVEYQEQRGYYIPKGIIKANKLNTITVRVYDLRGNGGIYNGPVGIISQKNYIQYWRTRKQHQ